MHVTYNPTHNALTIQLPASITGPQIRRFVGGLHALLLLARSPDLLADLKGAALSTFFALAFRLNVANQCTPELDLLETDSGYSRATVVKGLDLLEARKLISRIRRKRQSTLYRLSGYQRLLDAASDQLSLESKPEQPAAEASDARQEQDDLWQPVQARLKELGINTARITSMIAKCRKAGRSYQWVLAWIAAFEDARSEKSGRVRGLGYIISAIEQGWELPDDYKLMALTPEELAEKERRDRLSYMEGEFAHLIEH